MFVVDAGHVDVHLCKCLCVCVIVQFACMSTGVYVFDKEGLENALMH